MMWQPRVLTTDGSMKPAAVLSLWGLTPNGPLRKSHSNERLRVSNWIVQRLYDYAVKKRVELRFLTVFQHVFDPTRVRAVADKYSAMTPVDLRPALADQFLKSESIAMRW